MRAIELTLGGPNDGATIELFDGWTGKRVFLPYGRGAKWHAEYTEMYPESDQWAFAGFSVVTSPWQCIKFLKEEE